MPRVLINGFGRIGRSVLRALTTTRKDTDIEVAMINDLAAPEHLTYLFKYDSIFGRHPGTVSQNGQALSIDGHSIPFLQEQTLTTDHLHGIDCVLDCTGRGKDPQYAALWRNTDVKRVLVSGPCPTADLTLVLGANTEQLADQQIISLGSCTTNAVAPLLPLIDRDFDLTSAHVTTIHCYTASQPSIDTANGTFERARAASLSMVPTTTSAATLIDDVLPHLKNRTVVSSVRVPTPSVSAVDLVATCRDDATPEEVNAKVHSYTNDIIGCVDEPLVSSDLRMRSESVILAMPQTRVIGRQIRLFGWYDNEWGFANRMIDVASAP